MTWGSVLNKISPIRFDVKNPQTPADHGIKGRAPDINTKRKKSPTKHTAGTSIQ